MVKNRKRSSKTLLNKSILKIGIIAVFILALLLVISQYFTKKSAEKSVKTYSSDLYSFSYPSDGEIIEFDDEVRFNVERNGVETSIHLEQCIECDGTPKAMAEQDYQMKYNNEDSINSMNKSGLWTQFAHAPKKLPYPYEGWRSVSIEQEVEFRLLNDASYIQLKDKIYVISYACDKDCDREYPLSKPIIDLVLSTLE